MKIQIRVEIEGRLIEASKETGKGAVITHWQAPSPQIDDALLEAIDVIEDEIKEVKDG